MSLRRRAKRPRGRGPGRCDRSPRRHVGRRGLARWARGPATARPRWAGTREGEDADGTSDAEGPREVEDADVAVAPEAPSSAAAADEAPEAFTAPSAEPPPPDEPEASAEEAPSSAFDGAEAGGDDEGAEGLAGLEERDELLEMQTSLQEELANDLDLGPEADRHDPGRVAVELGSAFEQMFERRRRSPAIERFPRGREGDDGLGAGGSSPEAVWFVADPRRAGRARCRGRSSRRSWSAPRAHRGIPRVAGGAQSDWRADRRDRGPERTCRT
jgi:hypothetical protein